MNAWNQRRGSFQERMLDTFVGDLIVPQLRAVASKVKNLNLPFHSEITSKDLNIKFRSRKCSFILYEGLN